MAQWALYFNSREISLWTGVDDDDLRKSCEDDAVAEGLGARLKLGLALVNGVEIVKLCDSREQ